MHVNDIIKLSVVIPIYNEAENLDELYSRLGVVVSNLVDNYEIIGIDDGSTDESLSKLIDLNRRNPRFKYISLTRNFGQQAAQRAGFENAKGLYVATIDADLQNPPEELKKLYDLLVNSDYDVVVGWRERRQDSLIRTFGSKMVNWMLERILRMKIKDTGCNLRVYRAHVINELNNCREKFLFASGLIAWMGFKIHEIKISHEGRKRGKTKYSLLTLIKINLDLITGFSTLPLRIASIVGMFCSIIGLLIGMYLVILRMFYGSGPYGAISFLCLGFIFFGFQMFAMGLLGEYIGRLYIEILRRPHYIVKKSSTMGDCE